MCVVSNVGDFYGDHFPKKYPDWFPPAPVVAAPPIIYPQIPAGVSQEEFDKLKEEVKKMKKLLKMAKKIDEATGQPDCEMEQKIAILKKIAELVGVNLGDVFKSGEQASR
jgi:hypothetical protein